ncbi:MAG: hypothetical protein NWF00_07310 [Candidatus Bathyarchaeota archaeon]|nr:hypothetical protein [Candidatus Bathyarchaeota archaeon]
MEELRSRLSLVESTLKTVEQDIWLAFSSAMNSGISPPIIYPSSTFQRLDSFLKSQKASLRRINLDAPVLESIQRLNDLNSNTNKLLTEIMRMQNVLSQRTAGTDVEKIIEYKVASQEFCMLSKSYDAVDALTYELVERILGFEWINQKKYYPISLFDYHGYLINLGSYIISVPYHDSFRCRFWPSLAHEVGHIFVYESSQKSNSLNELILSQVAELEGVLNFQASEIGVLNSATNQLIELASDALSVYVCPTAFLSAASLLYIPYEQSEASDGALARYFKTFSHPPIDSRLALMLNVLKYSGSLAQNKLFSEHGRRVMNFLGQRNLLGLTPTSADFIEDYERFVKIFSHEIVKIFPTLGINKFGENEWSSVRDAFLKQDYCPLSPVQLLTVAWLKRLTQIENSGLSTIGNYLDSRIHEEKAFEALVTLMHNYYDNYIIGKMGDHWHDIRYCPD